MVGHFFDISVPTTDSQGNPAVQVYNDGTGLSDSNFRAFVLLHELGHEAGVLGDDNATPALSDAFNQEILTDCFGK
jgi:hypothetical protein